MTFRFYRNGSIFPFLPWSERDFNQNQKKTDMTSLKLLLMMCQRGSELLLQAKRANACTDSAVIASKYNDDYRIFAAEL